MRGTLIGLLRDLTRFARQDALSRRRSPTARRLVCESLETRQLLSVGSPLGLSDTTAPTHQEQTPATFEEPGEMWPDVVEDHAIALAAATDASAATSSYVTMVNNGPSSNRVDIVFLGDGYTAAQIGTTYITHINSLVNYLFHQTQDPFPRYEKFFNVHRIDVISNESGADVPPQGIYRDTALDASYYWDGYTERLLYVNSSKASAAFSAGLSGAGFTAEMRPITVNDTKYGGGGGTYAVYAGGNSSATDVALHESAHSFAGLADEYDYSGGATYTGSEPSALNVTKSSVGAKWSPWLGYTDPAHPSMSAVGAYQGAMYCTYGIYRPTATSKMQALGQPFNAVSREKIIRNIYALVDPLDSWRSDAGPIAESDPSVWVDTVDPNVISMEWKVDGVVVPGATGESFRLADYGFLSGTHTVTARAYDPTDWVRIDRSQLEQSVNWTVTVKNASISGQAFSDLNGNGAKDGGEPALAGWTIRLDLNNDSTIDQSATTDSSGDYSFTGLPAGTHKVDQVPQAGWAQTAPAAPGWFTLAVSAADNVTGKDFGNRETTSPTVLALTPLDGATGVAVDADFLITFDENVRKGTGELLIKRASDGSTVDTIDVAGALVTVAGPTATIDPVWSLSASTDFYLEVAAGAFEDLSGNDVAGISGPASWNFRTLDTGMRQIVADVEGAINAAAGQPISIPVRYTTSTGDNTLLGLGLRLHYNSSLLTFSGLAGVLPTPVLQQPPGDDTHDWDNDPATDKYVAVAWVDLAGNWPNQDLPTPLYAANFTAAAGAQTVVRFSAASTAGGYAFESRPITVVIANATLDADGNGTADALSDGILMIRYLFDREGAWNVNDALGAGGTRTTRQDIQSFLAGGITGSLDPDGNGTADALSDGVLILRYLFDPEGTWNVADALGAGATRTTRAGIRAYLDQFNPAISLAPPGPTPDVVLESWDQPPEDVHASLLRLGWWIEQARSDDDPLNWLEI